MEIYTIEIPYAETIRIVPFGDWHIGNINCNKNKIIEYIDWIETQKNLYWIGMGDYTDDIAPLMNENRFNMSTLDPEFNVPPHTHIDLQHRWVEEKITKIVDKCIGLHVGNHELSLLQKSGNNHDYVREDLCGRYEIRYLGYDALYKIKIMKNKKEVMHFTIHSTHGSTSAQKTGTKLNALENWVPSFDADIYLYGHTHAALAHRTIKHWTDGKKLLSAKKTYVLTGGFLEGYKQGTYSYIERKNLTPLKIGVVKISIYPDRKDIHAEA